jgi:hypothetical protein
MRCSLQVVIRQMFVIWMSYSPAHPPRLIPKEFQLLEYILHFLGVEMTDWMNLLCWYMFIINDMRSCSERTILHFVESYLYYIILVNKKDYFLRSDTREKINRQYTYIVENIKYIYTSFDEFFFPVSQRVEINYIFSDNIRILFLSWYVKSPKETVKLSKKSRNKRRSYRFLIVSSVKSALISINAVTVSYGRSTWIRYQKTISWSITTYNKKYPVNATAQKEQVQDRKKQ